MLGRLWVEKVRDFSLENDMAYVYGHYKEDTGELFYIGKGMKGRAWSRHRRNQHWHNVVNKHGYTVKILYDNLTEEEAYKKETRLILEIGLDNLVNVCAGGGQFTSEDAKHRSKNPKWQEMMQKRNKSLPLDPKWRKSVKLASKKRSKNLEWRKHNLEAVRKTAQTAEWKEKYKEGIERRSHNLKWRKNVTESNKKLAKDSNWLRKMKKVGKKNSENPEWHKKIREAWNNETLRKRVASIGKSAMQDTEIRKKRDLAFEKTIKSDEWKRKHAEGLKKYWENKRKEKNKENSNG
jgi:hypothetical protein